MTIEEIQEIKDTFKQLLKYTRTKNSNGFLNCIPISCGQLSVLSKMFDDFQQELSSLKQENERLSSKITSENIYEVANSIDKDIFLKYNELKQENEKYKNVWEDLKNPNGLLYARFGPYPIKDKVVEMLQELEQKYGLSKLEE